MYLDFEKKNSGYRINSYYTPLKHPYFFEQDSTEKMSCIDPYMVRPKKRHMFLDDYGYYRTKYLGEVKLIQDTISPTIKVLKIRKDELRFIIRDNFSGIRKFDCWVDGKWVLMQYDYKWNVIWSDRLDDKLFKGKLVLRVEDMAGNIKEYKHNIN